MNWTKSARELVILLSIRLIKSSVYNTDICCRNAASSANINSHNSFEKVIRGIQRGRGRRRRRVGRVTPPSPPPGTKIIYKNLFTVTVDIKRERERERERD